MKYSAFITAACLALCAGEVCAQTDDKFFIPGVQSNPTGGESAQQPQTPTPTMQRKESAVVVPPAPQTPVVQTSSTQLSPQTPTHQKPRFQFVPADADTQPSHGVDSVSSGSMGVGSSPDQTVNDGNFVLPVPVSSTPSQVSNQTPGNPVQGEKPAVITRPATSQTPQPQSLSTETPTSKKPRFQFVSADGETHSYDTSAPSNTVPGSSPDQTVSDGNFVLPVSQSQTDINDGNKKNVSQPVNVPLNQPQPDDAVIVIEQPETSGLDNQPTMLNDGEFILPLPEKANRPLPQRSQSSATPESVTGLEQQKGQQTGLQTDESVTGEEPLFEEPDDIFEDSEDTGNTEKSKEKKSNSHLHIIRGKDLRRVQPEVPKIPVWRDITPPDANGRYRLFIDPASVQPSPEHPRWRVATVRVMLDQKVYRQWRFTFSCKGNAVRTDEVYTVENKIKTKEATGRTKFTPIPETMSDNWPRYAYNAACDG